MSQEKIYEVPVDVARHAHVDDKKYRELYERSIKDPDGFWAEQAKQFITWIKPWKRVSDVSYDAKDLHIRWFEGATLNVSVNCIDRHLDKRADQVAIIWEGD